MTGIEVTAASCVLVDVRRGNGGPRLSAVHVVPAEEWPPHDLSRIRRRKRFAARAHVVAWTQNDTAMAFLNDAGFAVESVVSPEKALALLAAERSRPESGAATVWLALARQGAALAIVHDGRVLYSRRIEWRYRPASRPHEQLLQRYTLVSHLAPEIQHGIEVVQRQHGIAVASAVTCGDLPDLRSLTMPLIEELDLEVETLDSLDGLEVDPGARPDVTEDDVPALHLATAVTLLPPIHAPRPGRWWGRAAAAAVVLIAGAAGWLAFAWISERRDAGEARQAEVVVPAPTATAGSSVEPPVVPLIPQPAPAARRAAPPAVSERLPAVSSILIGADRRLAIVGGAIVAEGDAVGRRRVSRIERNAVVLRDPSGDEVRVAVSRLKQAPRP
jgi:hypothetical protein